MTKKQKKTLYRILAVLAAFVILLVLDKTGVLEPLPGAVVFILFFIPYLVIGYDVIRKAFKNIAHGQVFDENFLMMIATFAAFGLGAFGEGEYTEALAVMLFYQIGELFQSYAVGKSRQSISQMMSIAPDFAYVERDGEIEELDPEEVQPGDILVIRPGEKVPLDGVVIEGETFLDTAALTGESVPRRVRTGEDVISGCVNGESLIKVRVTKPYEDSTVARILELVENASSRKAHLENFITRFAKYYTPVVTIGAVILAVIPPLLGMTTWADGIRRACNFLIVSCPCALVISVPLGFFGGIGAASRIGVLVKGSNFLEAASRMSVVVMDKTGTLTKGEFKVQRAIPSASFGSEAALLEMAAHGEGYSTHPIASSIRESYGKELSLERVGQAKEIAGKGICVLFDGKELLLGNEDLLAGYGITPEKAENETGTIIYAAYDGSYAGRIVIADTIKEGAAEAIAQMKQSGIEKTVMLSGDRREAAEAVAKQLGIDEVHAQLLPADKVQVVEQLMKALGGSAETAKNSENSANKLGFVGDGINDAPVLMRSDVGIAMGSLGSDAAIEAADIVLMDDDIRKIPAIIRIARKTMGIVKANIAFALIVKIGILILSAFGMASMWMAVFADVGVAVLCILNSMRALNAK
ncbi:MAG: cadmium-translocating P-type ATPase [Lachnospiraceae bacterium]|nr:cadmium-translocating P-type ATPase [Lachnospiraceae bacterium]